MQVRKRPTTAPSPPTHPPIHRHAYRPTHCPATPQPPAFAFDPLDHSLPPPSPTNTHTLPVRPPPPPSSQPPSLSVRTRPTPPGPHLPVHTSRSTPPRGGSTGGGDQRCPLCPVRSVKLQLFFLQHGSLTARSCLLRCLRISFPSHPGRLVHTF